LDKYQLLQKNKVLFVWLFSENKQKILIDAFKEIATCIKANKARRIAFENGLVVNESIFFFFFQSF